MSHDDHRLHELNEPPPALLRDLAKTSLDLTEPELLALRLISHGLTLRMVASETGKTYETIKTQIEYARIKLGAKTTSQAVAEAIRRGLIP